MNFKRLLLSLPLLAAIAFGCNNETDPEPLNVLPAKPLADFTYSGGTTYPNHSAKFVEFLYGNEPVVSFQNLSANATNYLWHFGDSDINKTSDTISTEMNPTHKYTQVGQYTVNLTAYQIENGDTLGVFSTSRTVRITFPRYKLLGKYAMSDTISMLNSTADSVIAGVPPLPNRAYRQDYAATISVRKTAASDSNKVDIINLAGSGSNTRVIAEVDPNNPFNLTIPNQRVGTTNDSIYNGTGRIKGNTLEIRYTLKNINTKNTRFRHGSGNK